MKRIERSLHIPFQVCTQCVMDTTDLEISFDENGICNHCLFFEKVLKKNWLPNSYGEIKLDGIIKKIQQEGQNNHYDCVIGLSGGVDSTYLAYILKMRYPDLKILAIHIDGGWNSELAVHNIENIVRILKIDLYTGVIPWGEMQDLQLAYFKSQLANQDVPQDHAFFATLYHVAMKNNIKYFLSGGNLATESILPSSWGYDAMDATQLKAVHQCYGNVQLKHYQTVSFFKRKIYYPYIKKFKIIRPLDMLPYNKEEAKEIIKRELDWRDYGAKHCESRFTKFFQSYWLPKKFGFDKRKAHLSSLIVSGQMSREDALKELQKPPYDENEIESDKLFVAKKLGICLEEFEEIMQQPNKHFMDYPSDYKKERFFSKLKERVVLRYRRVARRGRS
jgi:N-acetyl sugar amidotransferase